MKDEIEERKKREIEKENSFIANGDLNLPIHFYYVYVISCRMKAMTQGEN